MTKQPNAEAICERLIELGYAMRKRVRMYGEEFELISNPFVDESGFAVQALSSRTGETRQLRIPLSVLRAITRVVEHPDADAA